VLVVSGFYLWCFAPTGSPDPVGAKQGNNTQQGDYQGQEGVKSGVQKCLCYPDRPFHPGQRLSERIGFCFQDASNPNKGIFQRSPSSISSVFSSSAISISSSFSFIGFLPEALQPGQKGRFSFLGYEPGMDGSQSSLQHSQTPGDKQRRPTTGF